MNNCDSKKRPRLPEWIRVKTHTGKGRNKVKNLISDLGLHTVCESAGCPNLGECWHKHTATFMILGNICTRNCKFCAVTNGSPLLPDSNEPKNIAIAVKRMNLKYAVITSVTRDDLADGGASIFAEVIKEANNIDGSTTKIEVLTPDFKGSKEALRTVLEAKPAVFNHNIETVERLSKEIRITATYKNSLTVLKNAVEISNNTIPVKSGLMVGLGENDKEVLQTVTDIRNTGAKILTIGQYLPPTTTHWKLDRYVHPDTFKEWKEFALSIGFTNVASDPLVRSSYQAEELNG